MKFQSILWRQWRNRGELKRNKMNFLAKIFGCDIKQVLDKEIMKKDISWNIFEALKLQSNFVSIKNLSIIFKAQNKIFSL